MKHFDEKQKEIFTLYADDLLSSKTAYCNLIDEDEVKLDGSFNVEDLKKIVAIMEGQ